MARNTLRRTLTASAVAVAAGFGLLFSSGCSMVPEWTIGSIAAPGEIESISCDQLESARAVKDGAVAERDTETLTILRIQDFNEAQLQAIDQRFTNALAACSKASASVTPTSAAPSTSTAPRETVGTVEVGYLDGARQNVPTLINPVAVPNGDTTARGNVPGLDQILKNCPALVGWDDLVRCVNTQSGGGQWYKNGVNRLFSEGKIQFNWAMVEEYAAAKTSTGSLVDARSIVVECYTEAEMPKAKARENVAWIINDPKRLETLDVVYRPCNFMNTWRTPGPEPSMTDFLDPSKIVHVQLQPLVLSEDKKTALGKDGKAWSGVDGLCKNPNGRYPIVPEKPGAPLLCPPGTAMAGQPLGNGGCNPPPPPPPSGGGEPECVGEHCNPCVGSQCNPCVGSCGQQVCPPGHTGTPPLCKDPATNDPAPQGNAPTGGGRNEDPGPGPYIPPEQMTRPPDTPRVNPPAPAPAPVPDATPVPTFQPPPPATGAPAPDAPADTCVNPPGMQIC